MREFGDITTYEEAFAFLNSFINYEKKRSDQFSPDVMSLDRPRRLLKALGNPHLAYPTIHIAGTKGKGSTAAFCTAVLHAAGYRVGLYTSPHLLDFRERFRVLDVQDEKGWVTEAEFVELVNAVRAPVALEPGITWYEIFTVVAFLHFARKNVDVAVVEVGLGGRLDATTVITPSVSVITSISMDHMSLLGDSLALIAAEKGGIIKADVPVVIGPQVVEAEATLREIAEQRGAPIVTIGEAWQGSAVVENGEGLSLRLEVVPENALFSAGESLELGLLGGHQAENALAAMAALEIVRSDFPGIDRQALAAGLRNVVWPGRLQQIQWKGKPTLIVDGAHNANSAARLIEALKAHFSFNQLILIMGSGVDKDYEGMLREFVPAVDWLILTSSPHPRAAPQALLQDVAATIPSVTPTEITAAPELRRALEQAVDGAEPTDLICVTGTLFLVAELLKEWDNWQLN